MLSVGDLYERGVSVPKDIEEAIRWYQKAADAGSEDAKAALTRLGR